MGMGREGILWWGMMCRLSMSEFCLGRKGKEIRRRVEEFVG